MLQRQFRLPAGTRLTRPTTYRTTLFLVKITKTELTVSRFGFVVRKAIDKRAVVRNRIRRVFRSGIESLQERIQPSYDMLFFLEKGIMDKSQEEVISEIEAFLHEQKLLK